MLCLVCPLLLHSWALTQNGPYRPSHLQQHLERNTVPIEAFSETEHFHFHTSHRCAPAAPRLPCNAEGLSCASPSMRAKGTFSHLMCHTWTGQELPKEFKNPLSCRELLPLWQSHAAAPVHSESLSFPVPSSATEVTPAAKGTAWGSKGTQYWRLLHLFTPRQ